MNRSRLFKVDPMVSLVEAMGAINKNGLGIVFVVGENDRLIGCASDGDIRRGILNGVGTDEPIREVMNEDPVAVEESWSSDEIARHVRQHDLETKVPRGGSLTVPVIDGDGRIIEIIRVTDDGEVIAGEDHRDTSVKTVLVVGGAGYIGSVLVRELLDDGFTVRVLDNLLYGSHGITGFRSEERFTFIEGDMRSIEDVMDAIKGADAVVHLGALVGDPASAISPQKTLELNYHATKLLAEICKYHQINRFIFASTCSVYGRSARSDGQLPEDSALNPVSLYAKSKIESEKALLEMRHSNFSPTIFRMATLYGLSPRMRFDLVVNVLTAKAHSEGEIPIFGGDQYRPNVHVRDAARAYVACLKAPIDDVDGEVFNVGSNEQNYRIVEVGEIVASCFPDASIDLQEDKEDERSYRVDFSKIHDVLDYDVEASIESGVNEIKAALESGEIEDYTDDIYSNYRSIEDRLLSSEPLSRTSTP